MKTRKRIMAFILIGSMFLVLPACNNGGNISKENPVNSEAVEENDSETLQEEDPEQRLVSVTCDDLVIVEYAYDEQGRPVSIQYPNRTFQNIIDPSIVISYDEEGRLKNIGAEYKNKEWGEKATCSGELDFNYDKPGVTKVNVSREMGSIQDVNAKFSINESIDENGNLSQVWHEISVKYDGGLLKEKEYYKFILSYGNSADDDNDYDFYIIPIQPEAYEETYQYDDSGNILEMEMRKADKYGTYKMYRKYFYDKNGNVSNIEKYYDTGVLDESIKYEYDDSGNVIKEIGKDNYQSRYFGVTTYKYDEKGRVTEEKKFEDERMREMNSLTIKYTYDEEQNLITEDIEYKGDGSIGKGYTNDSFSDKREYAYRISEEIRPEYVYDEKGNLLSLTMKDGEEVWHKFEYTYDEKNNILSIKAFNDRISTEPCYEYTYDYSYDEYGSILSVKEHKKGKSGELDCEYVYHYETGSKKMPETGKSTKEMVLCYVPGSEAIFTDYTPAGKEKEKILSRYNSWIFECADFDNEENPWYRYVNKQNYYLE